MRALLILIAGCILAACSDPKIDASSEEALEESMVKVGESLTEDQRKRFAESLMVVSFQNLDSASALWGGPGLQGGEMRRNLHGKTAEEIIAEADGILAERRRREEQQAIEEIAELKEKKERAAQARQELMKFEVMRSRFYKEKRMFTGEEPVIELSVKNGTEYAVSRAYFEGTIASPGRSVPWLKETFSYNIPGGLEPGESASWILAPGSYSKWSRADVPEGAVFTVETIRLDGADGEALFGGDQFSERDQDRLEELLKEYGGGELPSGGP